MDLSDKDAEVLGRLAKLDEHLRRRNVVLDGIPARLRVVEEKLEALSRKEDVSAQAVKDLETKRRDLEAEITDLSQQLSKYKIDLMSVKTNEAYKKMLEQIAATERKIDSCETGVLVTMEEGEAVRRGHAGLMEGVSKERAAAGADRLRIERARDEAKAWVESHQEEREALLARLSAPLLREYQRIHKRYGDLAVVALREGICSGCQSRIPPQVSLEVRRGGVLHRCSNCGRILIAPAQEDPAGASEGGETARPGEAGGEA